MEIQHQEPLKLYSFSMSQPCRSVLMLCAEGRVEFEHIEINLLTGQQNSVAYMHINPQRKVPTIDDSGFVLSEAAAIMAYICDSRCLESWYPHDHKLRARVDYWLHWSHSNARLSSLKYLIPRLYKLEDDPEGRAAFAIAMGILDVHLSHHIFLVEKTVAPTIADLMILPELDQLNWVPGLFDFSHYPHVMRYMENMKYTIGRSYDTYAEPARETVQMLLHA